MCSTRSSHCSQYHSSYEDSGGGCDGGSDPDHEWKWRMHTFKQDIFSRQGYCHILEAMGWVGHFAAFVVELEDFIKFLSKSSFKILSDFSVDECRKRFKGTPVSVLTELI